MQNFDDLDIEGRNPSHLSEEEREKEEHDRKRLMRSSVTAEDGTLRPVYSITEDDDIWCHICNISLFGAHKLMSHNSCNRHKMKLDECPYSVSLWSKRVDASSSSGNKKSFNANENLSPMADSLAPGEPIPPGMEDQLTRSTTIQVSLDRHRTSPLVGLEYLLELVDNESCEPSYTCVLCDKRGDPRTVMAHIASYNHRITYLNRHFPTVSRAITELPRTANYKRGTNEISLLVAKKIEERFGRLQPQLVDKNQFEKNKMQYIKRVYQDYHFRETPELTFMEVYDVRWVTNFDEKMAEVTGTAKKEDRYNKIQQQYQYEDKEMVTIDDKEITKKEEKKDKDRYSKKSEIREKEKPTMKIRILTKDKINSMRKPDKSDDKIKSTVPVRPSDDTKSLSSLSSISSSPSPSRSRSRSRSRERRRGGNATTKPPSFSISERSTNYKYRPRGRSRYTRSRSRSPEPLRERDKWDKYREQIRRAEETLERALKFHEKNPEKHPSYPDEWKKFWNRRYKELQADGKDPSKHDFKPEWIEFWNKRMREIHSEQLQQRKEEIRKRLELPEDRPPEKSEKTVRIERAEKAETRAERAEKLSSTSSLTSREKRERSPSAKRTRHHVESDDDVEYVGTTKTEYIERHEPIRERDYGYTYARGRAGMYRTPSYYPPARILGPPSRPRHYATAYRPEKSLSPAEKDEVLREDLEIVGLLRLLTALEAQLGSLGPKIVSLLSRALAAEKAQPNSAEELLHDEEVSVLFETVKEKLKGQLFAGMIEKMAITPTKSAIQNIAQLLHKAGESKKKLEQMLKEQRAEEEERRKRREMELARPLVSSFAAGSSRTIYQRATEHSKIRSEPVSVPGVGAVDKVAIAQQIASALIAQGRTDVSQDELETLINAVVGMAEASQHSDKPITAASFVKGLTAAAQSAQSARASPTPPLAAPPVVKILELSPVAAVPKVPSPPVQKHRDEHEPSNPRESPTNRRETPPRMRETLANQRESSSIARETFNQRESITERPKSTRMESLSDNDLKTLLQNFKDLGTDEQHGLINFLKKLEATDPPRVEKLRGYVNLGTPATNSVPTKPSKTETPPREIQPTSRHVQSSKSGRSTSPFSTRKSNQNPTDDDSTWKPKLDMFADDEEDQKLMQQQQQQQQKQQQQQETGKRTKKLDLSDDDDDYTFEDIYKAADKNVNENEKARRKKSRSRSNSSRSWSRSRSRSTSRSRSRSKKSPTSRSGDTKEGSDPNAILNETKRLIANIMGDLPNKYVVKSHAAAKSEISENVALPSIPQLPLPQQNLYGSNYPSGGGLQQQQVQQTIAAPAGGTMNYQQMGNHQFANYQQQQTSFNANPGGYANNGYNYNQPYGNMGNMMTANQQQAYVGSNMQQNQYGLASQQQQQTPQHQQQQQMYGMAPPQYGGQNSGAPIGYPQQQYGNYSQQRFY